MSSPINVEYVLRHPDAKEPAYGSDNALCLDVTCVGGFAGMDESEVLKYPAAWSGAWRIMEDTDRLVLAPGMSAVFRTGLLMAPPPTHGYLVRPRSSMGLVKVTDILAGVVESDYRGELLVGIVNHNKYDSVVITAGDKIAQLLFVERIVAKMIQVTHLDDTQRGSGAFGSTGN